MICYPSDWFSWLRTRPRFFRIFLGLIFIKPAIDILWDVHVPTLPITFLQSFGVLLVAVCLASLLSRRPYKATKGNHFSHLFFAIWITLQILNEVVLLVSNFSFDVFGLCLKVALPLYIYVFYRRHLFSQKDLDGILTTFYYSLSFLVVDFLYHFVFAREFVYSRGLTRLTTGYADVASLGISLNLSLLIVGYFLLKSPRNSDMYRRSKNLFYVNIALGCLILFNIHHAASTLIFIGILLCFLIYAQKRRLAVLLALGVGLLYVTVWPGDAHIQQFSKLYGTDIAVMQGEAEESRAFHGRMGRWQRHFELFSEQDPYIQLVGGITIQYAGLLGHGPHNDYLRVLFSSGYIGLFFYVLFLLAMLKRSLGLSKENMYLVQACFALVVLQSISLTPTTYHSVNFVFMAVVVWSQLAKGNRELDYSPLPMRRDPSEVPNAIPITLEH